MNIKPGQIFGLNLTTEPLVLGVCCECVRVTPARVYYKRNGFKDVRSCHPRNVNYVFDSVEDFKELQGRFLALLIEKSQRIALMNNEIRLRAAEAAKGLCSES